MVRLILITWIKLSQMERFQLSRKEAFYIQNSLLELANIGQILWKVLTVMFLWW